MKRPFLPFLLGCLALLPPGCGAQRDFQMGGGGATLIPAAEALSKHDLSGADSRLEEALRGKLPPDDRAMAERMLATLAWRFRGDPGQAELHFARALAVPAGRSWTFSEMARMETAQGSFDRARESALAAVASAQGEVDVVRAATALGRAAVERASRARLAGESLARPDSLALVEALGELRPLVQARAGLMAPSRVQVTAALLLDDGPDALAGWRSYYLLATGDPRSGPLAEPRRALEALLPRWAGRGATRAQRAALVRALAASRMFDEAALVALDPRVPAAERVDGDPEVRAILAYAGFCRRVRDVSDA
ncbi:MAG: hypothetical protein JO040_15720, partial [Gemmatimonadetes bacterium]|nr:hypothetical protein [Gemmatimonadota bacterium]